MSAIEEEIMGDLESSSEDSCDDDDEDGTEDEECDVASDLESSGDEDADKCAICLAKLKSQQVGTPESCDHTFCLECIQEWAKNVNTCPVDRQVFNLILARSCLNGNIIRRIEVEDKQLLDSEDSDLTFCEVCGRSDREDRLLLCDGCDLGYHCECLDPPLDNVPVEEWFCPDCAVRQPAVEESEEEEEEEEELHHRRRIARTGVSERVRRHIRQMRANQAALTQQLDTSSEEEGEEEGDDEDSFDMEKSSSSAAGTPVKPKRQTLRRRKAKSKASSKRRSTSKKSRRRRTKRKTKRKTKKKKKRLVKSVMPTTVKKRLASRLGLVKLPTGHTMPLVKVQGEKELEYRKTDIGVTPLSIMGHKDDLDSLDLGSDSGELPCTSSGSKRRDKYSASSRKSRQPIGRPRTVSDMSCSTASDSFLDNIMQGQSLLHSDSKDVTIHRDGSLMLRCGRKSQTSTSRTSTGNSNSSSDLRHLTNDTNATIKTSTSLVDNELDNTFVLPTEGCETLVGKEQTANLKSTEEENSEIVLNSDCVTAEDNTPEISDKVLGVMNVEKDEDCGTSVVMVTEETLFQLHGDDNMPTVTCEITSYDSDMIGLEIKHDNILSESLESQTVSTTLNKSLLSQNTTSSIDLDDAKEKSSDKDMSECESEPDDKDDTLELFIPKVPISELPRIPKLKRHKKQELVVDEEPLSKKPCSVLSKLDTPALAESYPKVGKTGSFSKATTRVGKDVMQSNTTLNSSQNSVAAFDTSDVVTKHQHNQNSGDKRKLGDRSETDSDTMIKDNSRDAWLEKVSGQKLNNDGNSIIRPGNISNNASTDSDGNRQESRSSREDRSKRDLSSSRDNSRNGRSDGAYVARHHRDSRSLRDHDSHHSDKCKTDDSSRKDGHSKSNSGQGGSASCRAGGTEREKSSDRDRKNSDKGRSHGSRKSRFDDNIVQSSDSNLAPNDLSVRNDKKNESDQHSSVKQNSATLVEAMPVQSEQQSSEYDPFNPTDSDSPVPDKLLSEPSHLNQLFDTASLLEEQNLIGPHMTPDLAAMSLLGHRHMLVNPLLMGSLPRLSFPPGWQHLPPGMRPGLIGSQQGIVGGQPTIMGNQAGIMGNQHGIMGNQPGIMGNQPGIMGNQPGIMGNQPGIMGSQTGIMGNQHGIMGSQPGILGNQPGILGNQSSILGNPQVHLPGGLHLPHGLTQANELLGSIPQHMRLHGAPQGMFTMTVPPEVNLAQGIQARMKLGLPPQMSESPVRLQTPVSLHGHTSISEGNFSFPGGVQGRPHLLDQPSQPLYTTPDHLIPSSLPSVPVSIHTDPRMPSQLMDQLSSSQLRMSVLPHNLINTRLPPPPTARSPMPADSTLMPPPRVPLSLTSPSPLPARPSLPQSLPSRHLVPPSVPQDILRLVMRPPQVPAHAPVASDTKLLPVSTSSLTHPPQMHTLPVPPNYQQSSVPSEKPRIPQTAINKMVSPDIQEIDMDMGSPLDNDDFLSYSPGDEDFTKMVDVLEAADDLPSSAVEFDRKQKLLKKMNRQERVVDEVKMAIKPFYNQKVINKKEYKEIMRKAVPKICHSKSGDINPAKIKALVDGYVNHIKRLNKYISHKKSSQK